MRCRVRNESDTEAYIRAAVTVNWKKVSANEGEADYVYAIAPVEGVDYSMEWNTNKRWIKHEYSNGEVIYYQVSPVGPKVGNDYADSYPLFNNFKQLSTENQPEGYELVVEVVGSGIQSTPVEVVEEQWGVTISGGNITGVTTN
ncbi:MAG: hypothetical protein E7578_08885 [Ruminococcaceae bacterium]|nr:hypothetical protein [Oscillospiraceae bacterium]